MNVARITPGRNGRRCIADYGHEEAAALHGKDPRAFALRSERFLGDDKGGFAEYKL
jgi:hypothetical protein